MTAATVVRTADSADREQVWALARDLATSYEVDLNAFTATFDQLTSAPDVLVLVAEVDGRIDGYLLGQRHHTFHANGPVVWVEEVMVAVDQRGAGIGRALMSAAELWTNLSFPRARLHVNRALELNPSASLAHHVSGCISGFAGDLDGAIAEQSQVYRVDPLYGHAEVVEADLGLWHLLKGDLESAGERLRRSVSLDPSNVRARQRQIALAGLSRDAALAAEALTALEKLEGPMDEEYLTASYPFQDAAHARRFRDGLRAAGTVAKAGRLRRS